MANVIAQSASKALQSGTKVADSWVKIKDGKVESVDWNGYVHSAKRMKSPPAFDTLDLSTGENNEFGDEKINNKHFTRFSEEHSSVKDAPVADKEIVKVMNAMNYVDNQGAAQHWRIRAGTADRDTSHAISAMLAIKLKMNGKNVDYATPWGVPHSGDYDLDELFQWADSITKAGK